MPETLEQLLKGAYGGLYGEVVTEDTYRLRDLEDIVSINDPTFVHRAGHKRYFDFEPDVIFDIGANIGIFTRYARSLFPNALIVSVEPHPENTEYFSAFTQPDEKLIFYRMALGRGQIWHNRGAVNGSGESYVSTGLGFAEEEMKEAANSDKSSIQAIMLSELVFRHLKDGMKSILKLDCEGGENIIWTHQPSMDYLKKIDYITGELHFYSNSTIGYDEMKSKTMEGVRELSLTHDIKLDLPHFWAIKKHG